MIPRRTRGYGSSQSSTVSPSTRENSRVLFVARINSAWSAWPAMSTSKGPVPLPACSKKWSRSRDEVNAFDAKVRGGGEEAGVV